MKVSRLRQVWAIVETTETNLLLNLSQQNLSHFLLACIEETLPLTVEENQLLRTYIESKIPLIRDLAGSR